MTQLPTPKTAASSSSATEVAAPGAGSVPPMPESRQSQSTLVTAAVIAATRPHGMRSEEEIRRDRHADRDDHAQNRDRDVARLVHARLVFVGGGVLAVLAQSDLVTLGRLFQHAGAPQRAPL